MKYHLLEQMGRLLEAQEALLLGGDFESMMQKCGEVDRVIGLIVDTDTRIACFRSNPGAGLPVSNGTDDEAIRMLTARIIGLAKRNKLTLKGIAGRLRGARDDIRMELDRILQNSQISGYRPFTGNRPIYVDRAS